MNSQSGEESADDAAADGEIMLKPPGLYTDLDIADRSLEEMVSKAAASVVHPQNRYRQLLDLQDDRDSRGHTNPQTIDHSRRRKNSQTTRVGEQRVKRESG